MSTIPRSTALAMAAALAACGGGGGEPTVVVPEGARTVAASANADATAANFATLAAPFVRAVLSGGAGGLVSPLASGRTAAQAAGVAPAAALPGLPGRMLTWLRRLPDPARKGPAAVSTNTLPCDFGGTITVRVDDADGDNTFSAGDRIDVTAATCVDDPALPAASGNFSMAVNAVELDGTVPVALDVTGSFQDFTLLGLGTMNGGFRLWTRFDSAGSTRLRVSYRGTTVAEAAGTVVYDFDIDGLANEQSGSFEISGGIGIGGATYAVGTDVRVQIAVGQSPSGGQAGFRDAAGDSVRLLPRSATRFDLEFLPAGATVPSATRTGLLWDDYGG